MSIHFLAFLFFFYAFQTLSFLHDYDFLYKIWSEQRIVEDYFYYFKLFNYIKLDLLDALDFFI